MAGCVVMVAGTSLTFKFNRWLSFWMIFFVAACCERFTAVTLTRFAGVDNRPKGAEGRCFALREV